MEHFLPLEKNSKHPKPHPMNKMKPVLMLVVLVVSSFFFHNFTAGKPEPNASIRHLPAEDFSPITENGKLQDASKRDDVFMTTPWEKIGFPVITEELALSLQHHLHVLEDTNFKEKGRIGNLDVTYDDLKTVIELLLQRVNTQPNDLDQYLDAWQTWGDDRRGNVYFTGYFTPALKVKKVKDSKYKYPLYAFPENWRGSLPSRKQIDKEGVLHGLGLELAYASNPLDVYIVQLQGSGTVEYVDTGERVLLRYSGENGHRYRNIQRFFRNRDDLSVSNLSMDGIRRFLTKNPHMTDSVLFYNPSYTFFTPKKGLVKGAAEVPLMEDISIAADPRYFPLGSVVLAALPVYEDGRVTHHQYRILLPQDVGGAVKGAGHVDVYCGNGELGRKKAAQLHHYGRMWVLLPKKNEQVAMKE